MSRNFQIIVALAVLIIVGLLAFIPTGDSDENEPLLAVATDTVVVEPELIYGINVDSLEVVQGIVQPNEFLANILLKYHLSYPEIHALATTSKDIFDVRSIASGKRYTLLCANDSSKKARCFIYEPTAVDYIVFDLRDSVHVYKGQKEVIIREAETAGVIQSSLYETLAQSGASPALAMELSDMYAWSIDFYRIQKGDNFKVIYEERYVDGEFIGVGEIKAALFAHGDRDFYGFYFEQEEQGDYFDEEANSLRKAFLQAPLKFSRISSGFTRRRFHPVQKRWKAHLGTDYAAPRGTPIIAVGDGVVIEAKQKKYNGKYVKIRHNSTYTTQYLHMSKIAAGMKSGKAVRQGDVIGYVGSTGLATGPHVCFRFWKHGKQVDHRREKLPPSKPIDKKYMEKYQETMKVFKARLEKIPFPATGKEHAA